MKFIVTDELGRLAKWLRILGFDTVVEKERPALAIKSLREERVILTRDTKMSRFTGTRVVRISSDFVEEQLGQLIKDLGLKIEAEGLFKLCVLCNERLKETDRDAVKEGVPEYVYKTQKTFLRCPRCKKIYWQGTHWELVNRFLNKVKT